MQPLCDIFALLGRLPRLFGTATVNHNGGRPEFEGEGRGGAGTTTTGRPAETLIKTWLFPDRR